MAKKNTVKVRDEDIFDFNDMSYEDSYDQDAMVGVMSGMLEASNNQMMMAIELTKLIVANNPGRCFLTPRSAFFHKIQADRRL
jgi:hypothetical protein